MLTLQKIPLAWSLSPGTESSSLESAVSLPAHPATSPSLRSFLKDPQVGQWKYPQKQSDEWLFLLNLCIVASGKVLKVGLQVFFFTEYRPQSRWPLSQCLWGEMGKRFLCALILPLHPWKGAILLYSPQSVPSMESVSSYLMQTSDHK